MVVKFSALGATRCGCSGVLFCRQKCLECKECHSVCEENHWSVHRFFSFHCFEWIIQNYTGKISYFVAIKIEYIVICVCIERILLVKAFSLVGTKLRHHFCIKTYNNINQIHRLIHRTHNSVHIILFFTIIFPP